VTDVARVGYSERIRLSRGDEFERVCANVDITDRLLDFRHVAGNALTSRAVRFVVRMSFQAWSMRTVRGIGSMAIQADCIGGLPKHRRVRGAVHVVTAEAGHPTGVHQALHEIVALHAVLVRGAVREVGERLHPQLMLLELPEVAQIFVDPESNRPIVVLAADGVGEGLTLRVALYAHVIRMHVVELGRIHDVGVTLMSDMLTAWTVTALAADVPLLGTKMRALYQRKKGRDLFDLAVALGSGAADPERIVAAFSRYMEHGGYRVSRAEFEENIEAKLRDPRFNGDLGPLLAAGFSWDTVSAAAHVRAHLIERLAGEPWKGDATEMRYRVGAVAR